MRFVNSQQSRVSPNRKYRRAFLDSAGASVGERPGVWHLSTMPQQPTAEIQIIGIRPTDLALSGDVVYVLVFAGQDLFSKRLSKHAHLAMSGIHGLVGTCQPTSTQKPC
jgi:hypothetical protein